MHRAIKPIGKLTSEEAAVLQGYGIQHTTLITPGLITPAVRIEVNMSHRLRNPETATYESVCVGVNSRHESSVRGI